MINLDYQLLSMSCHQEYGFTYIAFNFSMEAQCDFINVLKHQLNLFLLLQSVITVVG